MLIRSKLILTTCLLASILVCPNRLIAQYGTLTIDGSLMLDADARVQMNIRSNNSGFHDRIVVKEDLQVDGTLDLVNNGYSTNDSHVIELFQVDGDIVGEFDSINWLFGMDDWVIDYGVIFPNKITIIGPNNSILPLELDYFKASVNGSNNLLEWRTLSEFNVKSFELEYSVDGDFFYPLTSLNANGNSSIPVKYNYEHEAVTEGVYYYRLRSIDFDGTEQLYSIVSIRNIGPEQISFYPNPTDGLVKFSDWIGCIEVFSSSGNKVLELKNSIKEINLNGLPSGIYLIRINGGKELEIIELRK